VAERLAHHGESLTGNAGTARATNWICRYYSQLIQPWIAESATLVEILALLLSVAKMLAARWIRVQHLAKFQGS
jgi:uncharacterized membrane protein YcjF (UPF0283 family)